MAGPREQCGRTEPGLELERSHATRLGQRAGVGVGQRDDVAEYLVQWDGVALAFLTRWSRGELLQLAARVAAQGERRCGRQRQQVGRGVSWCFRSVPRLVLVDAAQRVAELVDDHRSLGISPAPKQPATPQVPVLPSGSPASAAAKNGEPAARVVT